MFNFLHYQTEFDLKYTLQYFDWLTSFRFQTTSRFYHLAAVEGHYAEFIS